MTVKIGLLLRGIDLRDPEAYERVDPELLELSWKTNGALTSAVLYTGAGSPVPEAMDWARRIEKLMPGVHVVQVHDELVTTSDIAARASLAAEAVRLWAIGKRRTAGRPFPGPHQVVGAGGGKTMSLFAWREVVSWIREVVGIDPDEGIDYLNDKQIAELNAEISDSRSHADAWQSVAITPELQRSAAVVPLTRTLKVVPSPEARPARVATA